MKYNWNNIDFKSFFSENVTFPLVIKAQMNNVIFKERWFLFFQQHGTKKKFWVPMRNWTSDLQNLKVWGSIPHGDSEFFFVPCCWKNQILSFLYFFTELKTYHLSNFNVICDTSSKNILNIHTTVKVREMAVETVQL